MPSTQPIRRALLSVFDKTGIVELATQLHELGIELISTGGTARALQDAQLPVRDVAEVTGFPEMLSGRVKTLHPMVHGGILFRRGDAEHESEAAQHSIEPIDLICINLYPFEQTIARPGVTDAEAIEQIDIGGPAMIRSAAKNHDAVTVLTSASQYPRLLEELRDIGGTSAELRRAYAAAAFTKTSAYDAAIAGYLTEQTDPLPETLTLRYDRVRALRYGENPHQPAAVYAESGARSGLLSAEQLHGKELSYNNLNDAQAAWDLARAVAGREQVGACVVKHANPCGASVKPTADAAVQAALAGDPLAAFGGILACTGTIDEAAADLLCTRDVFLEVVIAPAYRDRALELLCERWKNLRILRCGDTSPRSQVRWMRPLDGGMLAQTDDTLSSSADWVHQAGPKPTDDLFVAAQFHEAVARSLASNAVCLAVSDETGAQLVGAGAGQMDRVAACRIAIEKAGDRARGSVAFSDAFFPFSDGPQLLVDAGVRAIIHPGGSKRDQDTFELCESSGVTVLTTGRRHFRH